MIDIKETGYDSISFTTGTEADVLANVSKLNAYEPVITTDTNKMMYKDFNGVVHSIGVKTNGLTALDTPYYTRKMEEEGIYGDFVDYMDSLNTNPLTRPSEPKPSERLLEFAKKYGIN